MNLRDLLFDALLLREDAFLAVQGSAEGPSLALLTVLLAGVATALGQSVVLFINRVKPRRFALSVLISSAVYVFSYAIWALSIWGIGRFLFASSVPLEQTLSTVGLGYAPHLLGFLAFIPFLGTGLGAVLTLWSLLAIITGVQVGLGLGLAQAFVCAGLGWLVLQGLQRTVGYPLIALSRWLRARAAGVEQIREVLETDDLLELLDDAAQASAKQSPAQPGTRDAVGHTA